MRALLMRVGKLCGIFWMAMFSLAPSAHAVIIPSGYEEYLHVRAKIDGSDWFEMTGNQWRWEHRNYALPEIHGDSIDKTTVNGEEFLSRWPNPPASIPTYTASPPQFSDWNSVSGLSSIQDTFGLDVQVYLEKLTGRGFMELQQAPGPSNGYVLRVFMDDDAPSSHDFYEFKIWGYGSNLNPIPEPSSLWLLGSGLLGLAGWRRRKSS